MKESLFVLFLSAFFGVCLFLIAQKLKGEYFCEKIRKKIPLFIYHPNSICYQRVLLGWIGILIYFRYPGIRFLGIGFFILSAFMDALDGMVARAFQLTTRYGENLDPLCDKLVYLFAFGFFAIYKIINWPLVLIFVLSEFLGQFIVRALLIKLGVSTKANNAGKIKTCLSFGLVFYIFILNSNINFYIPDLSNEVLWLCILMSFLSSFLKLIPNKYYADILSGLNLFAGLVGSFLVYQSNYILAVVFVIIGQVFDLFDGRMAKKHGGTKFGPWLDDVADFVSFGICPALLACKIGHGNTSVQICSIIYILAIGFRLLRFLFFDKKNPLIPEGIFVGLPSPAGALLVMGSALLSQNLYWLNFFLFFAAGLSVSTMRFSHFGKIMIKRISRHLIIIFGSSFLLITSYALKYNNAQILGALLLCVVFLYVAIDLHESNLLK